MKSEAKSSSQVNFIRALQNLERSLATPVAEARDLSGIIKDFEMCYELSWKVLKKILLQQGHQSLGAKDVYTKAYQLNFLNNESNWLSMIDDRNLTSHVYDEQAATAIVEKIRRIYFSELSTLKALIENQKSS
jgi:nucleotidyltransferase substrate binding protein (TIGR01987 family)